MFVWWLVLCFVWVVVLGPFLFSNCLIPFSSHKSCGDFQVLVKGHWTYSWAYVWVCRVSHVSLTWTAGILEISCSLRGKKTLVEPCSIQTKENKKVIAADYQQKFQSVSSSMSKSYDSTVSSRWNKHAQNQGQQTAPCG